MQLCAFCTGRLTGCPWGDESHLDALLCASQPAWFVDLADILQHTVSLLQANSCLSEQTQVGPRWRKAVHVSQQLQMAAAMVYGPCTVPEADGAFHNKHVRVIKGMDVHVAPSDICVWHHACELTNFMRSHSPHHSAAHHALPQDLAGCVLINIHLKPSMGLHRSFNLVTRCQAPGSIEGDADLTASCHSATWALSSERLGPWPERREHMLPGLPGGVK